MRRRSFTPRASFEELEIRTEDGVSLRGVTSEPAGQLRGTCVLAGNRSNVYAALGFRTVAFDFRGQGDSGGTYAYDDAVRFDLPAVTSAARARGEDRPLVVVGDHAALAAKGTGKLEADAILLVGARVWHSDLEPSTAKWLAKLALLHAPKLGEHMPMVWPDTYFTSLARVTVPVAVLSDPAEKLARRCAGPVKTFSDEGEALAWAIAASS